MPHSAMVPCKRWRNWLIGESKQRVAVIVSEAGAYRSREAHECIPINPDAESCIVPGRVFGILVMAVGEGLIAYKSAPRLSRPPVGRWHIARYGGLRDGKPEHQQFAMNPGCSPQKILTHHADDELANLSGDSGPSTAPMTT